MCGILAVLGCSDDSQAKRVRVLELSRRQFSNYLIPFSLYMLDYVRRQEFKLFFNSWITYFGTNIIFIIRVQRLLYRVDSISLARL